jgi:hypothetical protein
MYLIKSYLILSFEPLESFIKAAEILALVRLGRSPEMVRQPPVVKGLKVKAGRALGPARGSSRPAPPSWSFLARAAKPWARSRRRNSQRGGVAINLRASSHKKFLLIVNIYALTL